MSGLTQREAEMRLLNEIPIQAPALPQPQAETPALPGAGDTWLWGVSAARHRRASLRVWRTCAGQRGRGAQPAGSPRPGSVKSSC